MTIVVTPQPKVLGLRKNYEWQAESRKIKLMAIHPISHDNFFNSTIWFILSS